MKPSIGVIVVLVVILVGVVAFAARTQKDKSYFSTGGATCSCACPICHARPEAVRLMLEHVMWTRRVVDAAFNHTSDLATSVDRLKQNQSDIANAISAASEHRPGPVYVMQKHLWDSHIDGAIEAVQAVISGDSQRVQKALAAWHANGQAIADSLSALRPKIWARDAMRAMMEEHLNTLTAQVLARSKQDWVADVKAQDAVTTHMVHFAHMLAPGLA